MAAERATNNTWDPLSSLVHLLRQTHRLTVYAAVYNFQLPLTVWAHEQPYAEPYVVIFVPAFDATFIILGGFPSELHPF